MELSDCCLYSNKTKLLVFTLMIRLSEQNIAVFAKLVTEGLEIWVYDITILDCERLKCLHDLPSKRDCSTVLL